MAAEVERFRHKETGTVLGLAMALWTRYLEGGEIADPVHRQLVEQTAAWVGEQKTAAPSALEIAKNLEQRLRQHDSN